MDKGTDLYLGQINHLLVSLVFSSPDERSRVKDAVFRAITQCGRHPRAALKHEKDHCLFLELKGNYVLVIYFY